MKSRPLILAALGLCATLVGVVAIERRRPHTVTGAPDIGLAQPSDLSTWPWANAKKDAPHAGVSRWRATSGDGTLCEMLEFDLKANPGLKMEIYAQDEDDAKPWDNNILFWKMGVGQAVRHLNARPKEGVVIAAANGPFFGYRRVSKRVQQEIGFHVAPVVVRGQVRNNTSNHRWSVGWKYLDGRLKMKTVHLPGRAALARYDFASGSVQCLIRDGKALDLERFPVGPRDFKKQPVASTPREAGHVPYFDHAKFSRVSMAWKNGADGAVEKLFWLIVREPNGASEGQSIEDIARWKPQTKGWNVPDVQRFWQSTQGAGMIDNAINSDAGDCAQLAVRTPNGDYDLLSPIGDNPSFERKSFTSDFKGAPQGGTVMYFAMRDAGTK